MQPSCLLNFGCRNWWFIWFSHRSIGETYWSSSEDEYRSNVSNLHKIMAKLFGKELRIEVLLVYRQFMVLWKMYTGQLDAWKAKIESHILGHLEFCTGQEASWILSKQNEHVSCNIERIWSVKREFRLLQIHLSTTTYTITHFLS